jgi:hypothetical protein
MLTPGLRSEAPHSQRAFAPPGSKSAFHRFVWDVQPQDSGGPAIYAGPHFTAALGRFYCLDSE